MGAGIGGRGNEPGGGIPLHSDGSGPKCRAGAGTGPAVGEQEALPVLPNWFTAFLVMLMEAWSARRDAHIRFLKLQVQMLRSRLPGNRVRPS